MSTSDTPLQVTHESLHQATNVLPDNVSALGETKGTLLSRQVPASAFGDVEFSAQAGQAHTETVKAKAEQLAKSQGRLDEIIEGIGRTTDQTAELDERQARDQREQNSQLAQTGEQQGGYRDSATIVNGGKDIKLTPRDPSWPELTIPNTVGVKEGFGMSDKWYNPFDPGHTSLVESRTKVPFDTGRLIANDELALNPTPGPDQRATPAGTRNNALDILPGMGYVVDGSVSSHVVPSSDPTKYTDTIVNYTYDEHWLSPGFIMRRGMLAEDGTMTLQTYGEGAGLLQHSWQGQQWRPFNWGLWEWNQGQIEQSILNRLKQH